VGDRAVIKPGVRVKYPWHLRMGNDCWLGEDCWIDNLAAVTLGSDVCISQGAYLCTGNHDWNDPAFGLRTEPISLGDSAWVGARAMLAPGVQLGEGAVAAAGSIVSRSIPPWEVHGGNPASFLRKRQIRTEEIGAGVNEPVSPAVDARAAGVGQ
jgi:putative colanic acid biosynthesis acetyltransferase WcaF